jgi:hypothetical protein
MDLLQLAKICRSEEEAFHFLFKKQRELNRVSCPEGEVLTSISCILVDFNVGCVNGIITLFSAHY